MKNLLLVLPLFALAGCPTDPQAGYGVALTLVADSSIPDGTLANVRTLDLQVSGAETNTINISSGNPFGSGREQRVIYRPLATSGTLTINAIAYDNTATVVGYGTGTVTLKGGATATLRINLSSSIPTDLPDFAIVPDMTPTTAGMIMPPSAALFRNGTQDFTATESVVWSVKEQNGGTIDQNGHYVAGGQVGHYTVVAASKTQPDLKSEAIVTISFKETVLLAGAVGGVGNLDFQGVNARLNAVRSQFASDTFGNFYFADNNCIRKVDTMGNVTTLAGQTNKTGSTDGVGNVALFNSPMGLALDSSGSSLYVADTYNHTIRRVTLATNAVTTVAGTAGMSGAPTNMSGAAARFYYPRGLAIDSGTLYVADQSNYVIQAVYLSGFSTSVFAGVVGTYGTADTAAGPPAVAGTFASNYDIAVSTTSPKKLLIAADDRIRSVNLEYDSATAQYQGAVNTPVAPITSVYGMYSVAYNSTNNKIYYSQFFEVASPYYVQIFSSNVNGGAKTLLAGSTVGAGYQDGPGTSARFNYEIYGLMSQGTSVILADTSSPVIRKIDFSTTANTVSPLVGAVRNGGNLNSNGTDGSTARFSNPQALAAQGSALYVGDSGNHNIRQIKIAPKGTGYDATVVNIVGNGSAYSSIPTPGASAVIGYRIPAMAFGATDRLLFSDPDYTALRSVDVSTANGVFTTSEVARSSGTPATQLGAFLVRGTTTFLGIDGALIGNSIGGAIGFWDPFAAKFFSQYGSPSSGVGDADGLGQAAQITSPSGLVAVGDHTLYLTDSSRHTIRKIDTNTGAVTTVAGTPGMPGGVDGAMGTSSLNEPRSAVYVGGLIYFADAQNHLVRTFDPATGVVTTVIGRLGQGGMVPGTVGTSAFLNHPYGLAILGTGEMAISSFSAEDAIVLAR